MVHNENISVGWEAAHKDADLIIWLTSDVPLFFKEIPAGNFLMGARGINRSEEPVHRVNFSYPIYLGVFPVTQKQFCVWPRSSEIEHQNGNRNPYLPQHPAIMLTWSQATAYCNWLTSQYREYIPHGFMAGLPTEAQWEYACRATTETEYHSGNGEAALAVSGYYLDNSLNITHPVGQKAPNLWGLYDMHGNVSEWCQDAWNEDAYKELPDGAYDPVYIGDQECDKELVERVIRGGDWENPPKLCRSAFRGVWAGPNYVTSVGFRVCLFPGPSEREASSQAVSELYLSADQSRQESDSQVDSGETSEVDLRQNYLPPRSD